MKLAVYPFSSNLNEYIDRMKEAFKMAYPDMEFCAFTGFKKNYAAVKDVDVIWLNWYENLPQKTRSAIKEIIAKIIKIKISKRYNKKIIATFHNKQPHEIKFKRLGSLFFKWYLKKADYIIILCEESRAIVEKIIGFKQGHKIVLVPHPSYKCTPRVYPREESLKQKYSVLFFGLLRPYKNVEMIMEVAKEHPEILFIIAGKPITAEYGEQISEICKNLENVYLDLKFQSDEDLNQLINQSSVLLLPYNTKSSLNSGVLIYALSKGINVIIPEIGGVKDINGKDKIYTYTYSDEKEHKQALVKTLLKAKQDYDDNYSEFVDNAISLRDEITTNNSIERIASQLLELKLS